METMKISATKLTPEINLDPESNTFVFSGKSMPENTVEFYDPVLDWIKAYLEEGPQTFTINIYLPFCSSSSSRILFDLFDMLDAAKDGEHSMTINWQYKENDEATLESGEEFQEDFENLNINLVKV